MFASVSQLFVGVTASEAKQYIQAWGDLGLDVETFTSDSKKLVLVFGRGNADAVATASAFVPTPSAKSQKGGTS